MKLRWNTLGGKLGLFFCIAGLAVIWAGWNGAASYNDIRKQFPYLISGGLGGLALVVIGVGLMVIQSQRADRVQLESNLVELRNILERMGAAPTTNGAEASSVSGGYPTPRVSSWPAPTPTTGRPASSWPGATCGRCRPSRRYPPAWRPAAPARPTEAAEVDLATPSPASGKPGR